MIDIWRKHFILIESMLKMECACLTPAPGRYGVVPGRTNVDTDDDPPYRVTVGSATASWNTLDGSNRVLRRAAEEGAAVWGRSVEPSSPVPPK